LGAAERGHVPFAQVCRLCCDRSCMVKRELLEARLRSLSMTVIQGFERHCWYKIVGDPERMGRRRVKWPKVKSEKRMVEKVY
jgi:hypothetical protein